MTPATPNDEVQFARLLAEWARLTPSTSNIVARWDTEVLRLVADQRALQARGAWLHGRSDMLGVLGAARKETWHSALIAWLLDPCGTHGLGARFLAGVLAEAFPHEGFDGLEAARTSCEIARGPCRADIIIELPTATIILENKVDAVESAQQCDTLFEQFADDPGCRFVFLTPRGWQPTTASGPALEAFARLSYVGVGARLNEALAASASAPGPGRHIAEDYLRTLEREFR